MSHSLWTQWSLCFTISYTISLLVFGFKLLKIFLLFWIFLYFFHYHITPYSPFPLLSSHCCPHPRVLFPFPSIPLPPALPTSSCQPAIIHESVSILLVSSACSLDSTNEWNHVVFVSDWLISLSIMFSRSTHHVGKGNFFFIFMAKY